MYGMRRLHPRLKEQEMEAEEENNAKSVSECAVAIRTLMCGGNRSIDGQPT